MDAGRCRNIGLVSAIMVNEMRVNDKKDLYSLIHDNKGALRSLGVRRLGVFGSFARGTTQDHSDVDLQRGRIHCFLTENLT